MNKSRFLLLLVVTGLLITPHALTSSANQFHNDYADSQEISFYGNVEVRGTRSAHITVAVDLSRPLAGIQADGLWDVVFHFVPKKLKPANQNISFDVENALVVSTGRRLTVLSNERHILLNLTLERGRQSSSWIPYYNDNSRDLATTVRINRGLALGQYQGRFEDVQGFWLCGSEGGRCSVQERPKDIRPMDGEIEPELPPDCPAGGQGATSCSISCEGGQGCSVTCGPGTYACCHCSNGCKCIKS
jgi:hypothetical protein